MAFKFSILLNERLMSLQWGQTHKVQSNLVFFLLLLVQGAIRTPIIISMKLIYSPLHLSGAFILTRKMLKIRASPTLLIT